MSRLLRNDFKRFWCSLRPVIAAAVAILAGLIAIPICPGYQAVMAYAQAYLFLIPVAGIMTIVFVTQEQNYGILRNKVAAGFSRTAIAASWSVVLASLCIFLLVVYDLTVFLSQHMRELAVEDVMSVGTLFTNNVMTLVLMLAFVWLSMAVCVSCCDSTSSTRSQMSLTEFIVFHAPKVQTFPNYTSIAEIRLFFKENEELNINKVERFSTEIFALFLPF